MVRREKSNYTIQSVSHALDVMEQFNGSVDEIGVTELSKRLKLHKNNVFRLLATLEARGYIEQNKVTENYRLGLKCLQLGQTFIHQLGLLLQARSTLEDLVKLTKESAFVAIRKGAAIVPLEFVEPARPVRVVSFLGTALPSHCTAAGKVYLVFESEGGLSQALPERLDRHTERRSPTANSSLNRCETLVKLVMPSTRESFRRHQLRGCACPWTTPELLWEPLVLQAPAIVCQRDHQARIVPKLLRAGSELSKRLGYPE